MGEADVPAQQPKEGEEPRLPPADVDAGRPRDSEGPSPQGSSPTVGLAATSRPIQRVRDRKTFERFRSEGRRVRRGAVTLTFVPTNEARVPRVAFAIGRRVGGAVVRNRLRRRLRAIARELAPGLRPGAYLIGAAPEAANMDYRELREMVEKAVMAVSAE